jgi:hypothetical protein
VVAVNGGPLSSPEPLKFTRAGPVASLVTVLVEVVVVSTVWVTEMVSVCVWVCTCTTDETTEVVSVVGLSKVETSVVVLLCEGTATKVIPAPTTSPTTKRPTASPVAFT